ncbi:MAG: hypothetical protein AB7O52_05240 [Planctomycetota bacterium]
MERIFDPWSLVYLGLGAAGAFVFCLLVRLAKGDGSSCWKRPLEAAILTFVGGLLARVVVGAFLAGANDSPGSVVAVGWAFLLWPGAINTIPWLLGKPLPIDADTLVWIATGVGCFTGMMDGLWRTRDWTDIKALGVVGFVTDVTWGLAGTTNSCLLHLVNLLGLVWSDHSDDDRQGAHRYKSGFRFLPTYAFTQGSVMSNMGERGPDTPLYRHEKLHVWQNRLAGPFFVLTYLGWMALLFIPSFIGGLVIQGASLGKTIMWWTYMNNPWEVWAYEKNNPESRRDALPSIQWSIGKVLAVAIPFYLACLGAGGAVLWQVW